jgi:membrane associated rhomboid family serine protease
MFPVRSAVPARYPAVITWTLIALNCIVFFYQVQLPPDEQAYFIARFALVPARYFGSADADGGGVGMLADYLPFVSNMFLHGGWLHLILNMWALWLFGPAVEDRLGSIRYLVFYVLVGGLASLTHAMLNPESTAPALGASGAIAGIMGSYIRLFPLARMVVMIPVLFLPLFVELPAILFAALWFMIQVLQGAADLLAPPEGGGVAWWAHVGGFVAGLLFTPALRRPARRYRAYYPDEGVLGFTPSGR